MASATMTAEISFRHSDGTLARRASAINEAVDDAARDGGHSLDPHAAAAKERLADDERGQADDDHAGAEVDVRRALVLGQHRAGQRGHGVGDAKAHRDGEGCVDGGRTDHVRVIAGSADGQAQRVPRNAMSSAQTTTVTSAATMSL